MKVIKEEDQKWFAGELGYCNTCGAEVEIEATDSPKDVFFNKDGRKVRKTAVFACPVPACRIDREGMIIIDVEV